MAVINTMFSRGVNCAHDPGIVGGDNGNNLELYKKHRMSSQTITHINAFLLDLVVFLNEGRDMVLMAGSTIS